ncbi:MAG TPA: SDR family oxidoreductase [Thermomicrobiales bacterium]|nr:SDR family oxidoreductase [Thermomicrobiales bacterium]
MTEGATGRLRGRSALVTGASRLSGIGAAVCRALAAEGAGIAFTHFRAYDRRFPWAGAEDEPARLEAELRAHGVRALAIEADLADPATPERVLDRVEAEFGPLRILVNNAAFSTNDGFAALDAVTLDAHYAVNVRAMALLSVGFARRYPAEPGGRIINFSSGQGRGPMPDELAYAASKGAVEAFTVSLSPAVAPLGITVNAVNPGPTDTGWIGPDLARELLPKFPFGRLGAPEDAARLVAWLASDDAAWITGQIINSEGGFIRR